MCSDSIEHKQDRIFSIDLTLGVRIDRILHRNLSVETLMGQTRNLSFKFHCSNPEQGLQLHDVDFGMVQNLTHIYTHLDYELALFNIKTIMTG